MRAILQEMLSSKKFVAMITAITVYVVGRAGFDVDPATLDRIFGAILVYVVAQGAADVGKSATVASAKTPPSSGPSGSSVPPVVLVLVVALSLSFPQLACQSAPQPIQAAVDAALVCGKRELPEFAHDFVQLGVATVDHYTRYKSGSLSDALLEVGKDFLASAAEAGVCAYAEWKSRLRALEQPPLPQESSVAVANVARQAPDVALDAALRRLKYSRVVPMSETRR